MSCGSFRTRFRRCTHRAGTCGLVLLVTAAILAGCGGSGTSKVATVSGAGFSFEAPATWAVSRTAKGAEAANGAVDLLQVSRFRLEKPYRVARFAAVSRELDGVADGVARQVSGRVSDRRTRTVAGRKTRVYRIDFTRGRTEEIAFVLVGSDEYQVLCRRRTAASDGDCARLFSSFALR